MDRQTLIILVAIVVVSFMYGISASFINNALSDKKSPTPKVSAPTSTSTATLTPAPTNTPTVSISKAPTQAKIPSFLRSDDDDDDDDQED